MSATATRHLNFIADVLEGFLHTLGGEAISSIGIAKDDFLRGKHRRARTVRHMRQPRRRVERVVIYRDAAPRVYAVHNQ